MCPNVDLVKKKEPWEDITLQQQLKELHKFKDHKEMRNLQKKIKDTRKRLKSEYYKELADSINTVVEARDVEKEFAIAKKCATFKQGSKIHVSNEKLETHFESHFAEKDPAWPLPPERQFPEKYQHLNDEIVPINEEVPNEKEVVKVLKSFKTTTTTTTTTTRALQQTSQQQTG